MSARLDGTVLMLLEEMHREWLETRPRRPRVSGASLAPMSEAGDGLFDDWVENENLTLPRRVNQRGH